MRTSVFVLSLLCLSTSARADEPWLLKGDLMAALPMSSPQKDWFGPGGSIGVGVYKPLTHWLVPGLKLRTGILLDGDPNTNLRNPGAGTWAMLNLNVRIRPFSSAEQVHRAVGPWIEVGGGGGLTGDVLRPDLEAGLGWSFKVGSLRMGPALRYVQIIDSQESLDSRDARLLLAGLEITLFDAESEVVEQVVEQAPPDRDKDGVPDDADKCPDTPEDLDRFEDEDGCPDDDNDQDKILDKNDSCPNRPEDYDNFLDEDGCPDPDNDQDGINDEDDQCPNDRETINGVDDHDGCPDEGLVELVEDRVILEERVLFDLNRSRVKSRAKPVLDAIVHLWKQHPEWTELRIEGHADAQGADDFNQELSERRAKNVMEALVHRGIPANIIEAEGYGSERLRDKGTTPEAHQRNRRVEFVVVQGIKKKKAVEANTNAKETDTSGDW
ncbi:MAG: OmpA family protein [Myxococcales bacterium]|nr:MAG: OmpA family protein [Myxococcales bacterium]